MFMRMFSMLCSNCCVGGMIVLSKLQLDLYALDKRKKRGTFVRIKVMCVRTVAVNKSWDGKTGYY